MTRPDQAGAGHGLPGGDSDRPNDLEAAIAALAQMKVTELRSAWRRLYRSEPPRKLRRDTLQLAVAWKLQARELGGLSATTTRQIADLMTMVADGANLPKARRVSLKSGARLVRHWRGETHEVLVTEQEFVWRDRSWKSLSVIAREITGARWLGPRFFGLSNASSTDRGRSRGEGAHADA